MNNILLATIKADYIIDGLINIQITLKYITNISINCIKCIVQNNIMYVIFLLYFVNSSYPLLNNKLLINTYDKKYYN